MSKSLSTTEYSFRVKDCLIGAQMLFVAFGALVLVPLLTGLDPNVAMFTAGAGTLLFQVVTRGKVPIFLASSFAFIAPIMHGVNTWGIPGTLCGLAAAGMLYMGLGLLIHIKGRAIIDRILPTVVTGPVIMVIGMILAPVAIEMALGRPGGNQIFDENASLTVSMIALSTTVLVSLLGKGMLRLIPILCGIVAGYIAGAFFGFVDFSPVAEAAWITVPNFVAPEWNWEAILYILPIAIAPAIEHIGDVLAISSITGKNYLEEPGVHRTMFGDGIATTLAAFFGGPPNTTYSEVSGAVALTKSFNPAIMTWAAITALLLAFVGKLGALLQTIPVPVMGGIMVLLFGAITVVGLNSLVRSQQDLMQPRNLAIVAIILVFGIGGMTLDAGAFTLKGIGLAGIIGVVLNLILPKGHEH